MRRKKGFLSSRKVDIQKQEKATQKIYLITEHSISFKHYRFTFLTIVHRMKLDHKIKKSRHILCRNRYQDSIEDAVQFIFH